MFPTRRHVAISGLVLSVAQTWPFLAPTAFGRTNAKAVIFDAFAIFDSKPVTALAERLYPGKGAALVANWRVRQYEYTWLRNSLGHYQDFHHLSDAALNSAANSMSLPVSAEMRASLLGSLAQLPPWPDAVPVLQRLKRAGRRLTLLSDLTSDMLLGCAKAVGAGDLFDHVLSTDLARAYKPAQRAYRLGSRAFALPREQIVFVASADWDAIGAKSFGYALFWVNRSGQVPEQLGLQPDATGVDLADLQAFVNA